MVKFERANVLKPLDKQDLKEGEGVDIELKEESLFGLLKGWKIDSQSLKDGLRELKGQIFCGYLRT
jgi:predicted DNA-binding antitoxin AbrB/MazE fold protein